MKNFDELRLRVSFTITSSMLTELEEEVERLTYQRDKALADAKMFEEIAEENQTE